MRAQDVLWLGLKELREKKVRTSLTIVMVVIGVAAIIALVSQTEGISASVQASLQSLGPTSIILISSSSTGFTSADVARLSTLPNVSAVIPIVEGSAYVYSNGQNVSATLLGISPEGLQQLTGNLSLYQGTMYSDASTPSAVIGHSVAFPSILGGNIENVRVGQPVTVRLFGRAGSSYTLPTTGVLNAYGTSVLPIDTSVMVSLPEAQLLLHRSSYSLIVVKANSLGSVNALATLLGDVYGNGARIITTQELLQTVSSIIGSITTLLAIIAGISLAVAAIGIMNVMLISVYERTHEIGIMKSLGFKARHILLIFIFQALIIGAVGGVLGIGAGIGASYALSAGISASQSAPQANATAPAAGAQRTTAGGARGGAFFAAGGGGGGPPSGGSRFSSLSYHPVFDISTILLALFVAVLVSVIAGLYPAWRASKMEPIDALRQL